METSLLKKFFPKFIIVEGWWGAGKTKLAKHLAKKYSLLFIAEPRHKNLTGEQRISNWYYHQHLKRQQSVRSLSLVQKIIMERSVIATAAYQYARQGKLSKQYDKALRQFPELQSATILFLDYNMRSQKAVTEGIVSDAAKFIQPQAQDFLRRYREFYHIILPQIIDNSPIFLITKKGKKFLRIDDICKNFEKTYISSLKKKKAKNLISGAAIIFYRGKVLLIYDKKWRHYVFPQGKAKKGENILVATIREVKEETGYFDVELLGTLTRYQYRYQDKNNLITKQIITHVFCLKSLKQTGKSLEPHEDYQNRFLSTQEAFKLLKWSEDQRALREAIKKIRL